MENLRDPLPTKVALFVEPDNLRYFATDKPGWKLMALFIQTLPKLAGCGVIAFIAAIWRGWI
jgi:hypothetical protein